MIFQSRVDRTHFETTEKNNFRQTSSGHFYLTLERKKQRPSYVGKLCWCMLFCFNYVSISSRGMHTHHTVYIGLISSFKESSDGPHFFFPNNCKTVWVDIAALPHRILDDQNTVLQSCQGARTSRPSPEAVLFYWADTISPLLPDCKEEILIARTLAIMKKEKQWLANSMVHVSSAKRAALYQYPEESGFYFTGIAQPRGAPWETPTDSHHEAGAWAPVLVPSVPEPRVWGWVHQGASCSLRKAVGRWLSDHVTYRSPSVASSCRKCKRWQK